MIVPETQKLEKLGWDLIEGIIAVTAGVISGSIALTGFGIDSAIEVFAASIVVWQLD